MSNTGKDTQSATTPSFVAAIVVAAITVGVFTTVWLILHRSKRLREVFQPRTEKAPLSKRPAQKLPDGPLAFWKTVFGLPDKEIIVANGPDAYFFVRYLKIFGLYMMGPYVLLTCAVLIPVSAVSPNAGLDGLNKLTFGNVAPNHQVRHVAHFLVAIILINWTLFLIWREYHHYVVIRQEWLSSPQHLSLARTRTVALINVPEQYQSGSALKELGGTVASLTGSSAPRPSNVTDGTLANVQTDSDGSIQQVWLPRKIDDVEDTYDERADECLKLEGGVGKLVKLANKNYRKGKTPEKKGTYDSESSEYLSDRFVLHKKRPTWKQGFLGLFGKKMTLETSPVYIREHTEKLDMLRENPEQYPLTNTAFIRFASQAEAHAFARLVSSTDKKLRMVKSSIEVVPEDVEWSNMKMNPYQRKIQTIISWSLTIGLIIIWAIPVAFVGLVSNVDTLCSTAPFLAWICRLPKPVLAIIKGVLPPVLLAVLFMLLPIVLRMMVKMQGEILRSDIELKLFTRYWLFQVIHGFLIVTLASGLVNALGNLGDTASSVPTLLATQLPGASIFFLTFILTATFTGAAKSFSRVVPVVMFYLRGILGGNTPRKWFQTTYKMDGFAWATIWPPTCLILCITIVYSVIQPIITVLAWLAFVLLFAAYKYVLYWCADQPDYLETGGRFYVKALRTVFVSLYLEEVCLAGLFFLSSDENGNRTKSGLACGAIMIAQIILTAAFQIYIDWFRFQKDYLVYAHSANTVKSGNAGRFANKVGLPSSENAASSGMGKLNHSQVSPSDEDDNAGSPYGNTSGFHERAFDHPAMWKPQPVIWITDDPLGVGKFEAEKINAQNVKASTEFTSMEVDGRLNVQRAPPDQTWWDGMSM